MRILLIYPHPDLASARIRILQMAPHLERYGHSCECVLYPSGWSDRRALARRASDSDVVVLHYRIPSLHDGFLWSSLRAPLVFDFDDAVPFRQRPRRGSYRSATRKRRFRRMLRVADAFAPGNDYLASLAAAAKKPMRVLPSPVPGEVPRASHDTTGPFRIGWIGGSGNFADIEPLQGVFRELASVLSIRLVVISDGTFHGSGFDVENVRWTLASQEQRIAELDAGIMPLEDTPWNRGKCAYKLLQYMAAELPCVASPVGMNASLIRSGENGLLAGGPAEWSHGLRSLAGDPELRCSLGKAGRATVESGYLYDVVAKRWHAFLEELRERAGVRG